MSYIYLFHWLLVGPLFIYLGLAKQNTPNAIFNLMFTMGVITIIYHFYLWYPFSKKGSPKKINL